MVREKCLGCRQWFDTNEIDSHIAVCPGIEKLRTSKPIKPLTKAVEAQKYDQDENENYGRRCFEGLSGAHHNGKIWVIAERDDV